MADNRTIILADDGRFVTMGRHSVPSGDEVTHAGAALAAQGVGGWLATMSGTFYQRKAPVLVQLREIAKPRAAWSEAVAKFNASHKAQMAALKAAK